MLIFELPQNQLVDQQLINMLNSPSLLPPTSPLEQQGEAMEEQGQQETAGRSRRSREPGVAGSSKQQEAAGSSREQEGGTGSGTENVEILPSPPASSPTLPCVLKLLND